MGLSEDSSTAAVVPRSAPKAVKRDRWANTGHIHCSGCSSSLGIFGFDFDIAFLNSLILSFKMIQF